MVDSSIFQPKRMNVPGLLSDEALQEQLKQFADAKNAQLAQQPPPQSAVDFVGRIQQEYLRPSSSTLRSAQRGSTALTGPLAPLLGAVQGSHVETQDERVDRRASGAADVIRSIAPYLPLSGLDELGTLSPEERQEEADRRFKDAQAREKMIEDKADVRRQLRDLTNDEANAFGLPTAPGGIDIETQTELATQDQEQVSRAQAKTEEAEAAVTDKAAQPTQEWWLNMLQTGMRSTLAVPTSVAKAFPIAWEMSWAGLTGENAERSDVRAWIDTVDATIEKLLPGDKARSKDFATQLAGGGGSMLAFLLGGWVASAFKIPASAATIFMGAGSGASLQFEDAENFNATNVEKLMSFLLGGGLGVTEAIPINRMLFRADTMTGGLVRRMLTNTAAGSIEEFLQELGQSIGTDVIAKLTYDENRLMEPLKYITNATVGAITGGLAGAAVSALHDAGVAGGDIETGADDTLTKLLDQALAGMQTEFDQIEGMQDAEADVEGRELLAERAPEDVQTAVQGPGGLIPVNEAGQFEISHQSAAPRQEIDPAKRGTGPLRGGERQRLFGEDVVDRSYFGVGDPQFAKKFRETQAKLPPRQRLVMRNTDPYHGEGLGPFRHTVQVDPNTIYNWFEDPLNLRAQLDKTAPPSEQVTRYEKLIQEAGFKGVYFSESPIGQTAMMFEKTTPTQVVNERFNLPVDEIATPEDFAQPTPETFSQLGGWAVLTGTQEAQGAATSPENVEANNKLRSTLIKQKVPFQEIGGTYQGVDQGPSFMVFMPEAEALKLGKRFKQESILTRRGLEYSDGRLVPAVPEQTVVGADARKQDFFSTLPGGEAFSIGLDFAGTVDPELLARVEPTAPARQKQLAAQVAGYAGVARNLLPAEREALNKRSAQTIVDIFSKLPDPKEMAAVAVSGRAKRGWYKRSAEALVDIFGLNDAPRFAGLLAALSPQTSVETNAINALKVWTAWNNAGRPTTKKAILAIVGENVQGDKGEESILDAWINNSLEALTNPDPMAITLSGPKVSSFMANLKGVVDEVTNDAWMANFANVDQQLFRSAYRKNKDRAPHDTRDKIGGKSPGYLAMNAAVRAAAKAASKMTGETWTPAEIQETVWSWAKTLYEKADSVTSAEDILAAGNLTAEDIASTPDFASLFVSGVYRNILEHGGYDIDSIAGRSQRPDDVPGRAGDPLSAEGTGIAQRTFETHLRRAARRLDALRTRRADEEREQAFDLGETFDEPAPASQLPEGVTDDDVDALFAQLKFTEPASPEEAEAFRNFTKNFGTLNDEQRAQIAELKKQIPQSEKERQRLERKERFKAAVNDILAQQLFHATGAPPGTKLEPRVPEVPEGATPQPRALYFATSLEDVQSYVSRAAKRGKARIETQDVDTSQFTNITAAIKRIRRRRKGVESYGQAKVLAMQEAIDAGAPGTIFDGDGVNQPEVAVFDEELLAARKPTGKQPQGTSSTRGAMVAEPTRPDQGIPATQGAQTEDVNLAALSRDLTKLMELTLRQGRLRVKAQPGTVATGQYDRKTDVARVKNMSDLSTIVHEAGHSLYFDAADDLKVFIASNAELLKDVADKLYGGDTKLMTNAQHVAEGFAEFFRIYTLSRPYAETHYAALVEEFDFVLDANSPELKLGLENIGRRFAAWLQLPSQQLLKNMIVPGVRDEGLGAAIQELREGGFGTWFQEVARKTVQESVNRYAALNTIVNKVLNIGQATQGKSIDLLRSQDPRALIRLAGNAGARAMVQTTDGVMGYRSTEPSTRGLREALARSQGMKGDGNLRKIDPVRQQDFAAYLVALRGIDEYRRLAEGKIDRPPVAATLGDLQQAATDLAGKYGADFTEAAKIVHEYGMALWQKMFDAGLMTKETYEDGLDRQFYAPLQRDMSDKKQVFGESVITGGRSIVKRFRGSDRNIIDPFSVLMHKTFAIEQSIARNDVMKALAILSDRAGKAGAMVERIQAHQLIGKQFSVQEVARQLTKDDTVTAADAQTLMTILDASIKDDSVISMFRSEQAPTKGENIVFYWEAGRLAALQLADGSLGADAVNVLNGVGRENMPLFVDLIAATSTAFRASITSWPDFLAVNFIRDQFSAFILTDVGFKPFATGLRGAADELRQNAWARQYNAAMGIMGGMNVAALHDARINRDINALRRKGYLAKAFNEPGFSGAVKGMASVVELTETGTRLGIFRNAFLRAKKDGLSDWDASIEAAYTATDYIDFGLNGSRMTLFRKTIPFLNAQLQGLYKMVRTLGADEVRQRKGLTFALRAFFKSTKNMDLSRTEKQAVQTGRKAWVKMAALGIIGAALHFLSEDDPDYQETSEYMRTTGWVIPMGDGRIFYIPKPFELAVLSNFVERGLEHAAGDPEAKKRFLRGLAMTMTPPTSPPAIQLAVEQMANKDFFTGQSIVPDYMQALDPILQYNNYTSELAKQIGEATGLSPMKVDHILAGLGASAYRDITTLYNATDPNRPSPTVTEAPIARRFVRDIRRGSASSRDFWAYASTVDGFLRRGEVTYRHYIDTGREDKASEYLATLDEDQRAYALLNTHFKAEAKRLNPFYRGRQITTIVSAMRREMVTDLGLEDTTTKAGGTITLTAREKSDLDKALSELARREMRNTLVFMSTPGWAGKRPMNTETTMDLIGSIEPRARDELERRLKKAKVYSAETVQQYWPETKNRLLRDRENTFLKDILAVAKVMR